MHPNPLKTGDSVTFSSRGFANIYSRSAGDRGVVVSTRRDPETLNRKPLVSVLWWDNLIEEEIDAAALKRL